MVLGCRFFLYFLIMFLVNQTSITVFRATAAIGRAMVLCNVVAFIYIAYSLMLCGFIITKGGLPLFKGLSDPIHFAMHRGATLHAWHHAGEYSCSAYQSLVCKFFLVISACTGDQKYHVRRTLNLWEIAW